MTEALHAYTVMGAYATFEETEKGAIKPGMLADFAVLAQDPRAVPPDEIAAIPITQTWIGGELVYENTGRKRTPSPSLKAVEGPGRGGAFYSDTARGAFVLSASSMRPVSVKMTRSQMFVTRSPMRSRLCAAQRSSVACWIVRGSCSMNVSSSR